MDEFHKTNNGYIKTENIHRLIYTFPTDYRGSREIKLPNNVDWIWHITIRVPWWRRIIHKILFQLKRPGSMDPCPDASLKYDFNTKTKKLTIITYSDAFGDPLFKRKYDRIEILFLSKELDRDKKLKKLGL